MSIERKIREMDTGLIYGSADLFSGVDFAKHRAAEIAKEADELMAEMAESMLEYDTMACRDEFGDILQKYWSWKGSTK